ncbi:MAG TPA: cyclic nucleotide-binding domain-containing protein [Gaiellaceae bacterium]|nr:cyclic nucleotide-binding domain-containing protein [Gaiellaceae bacterium]
MSETAGVDRLRELPLFAGLDRAALERVVEVSSELALPAGQVLMRADDPGAGMLVIEEGTVVVEAPGGQTIELGPGEFVGELSLLVPESTRVARVRAKTAVRCLAVNRATLEDLLDREPRFATAMLRVVAQRLWRVMHG